MSKEERWEFHPDWVGFYKASTEGRVLSVERKILTKYGVTRRISSRILTAHFTNGYPFVRLGRDGVGYTALVHRLVAETFLGPCPEGHECCHGDGNPGNPNVGNLRWDTKKNNHADKIAHGTSVRGSLQHRAILTEEHVREIRAARAAGATAVELGKRYGVTKGAIYSVVKRNSWAWLD